MQVLVADDHKDTAESLGELLSCRGFQPLVVNNGLDALDCLLRPDAPRLATLDRNMPGINGDDICREIRKPSARPYTYLILVTAQSSKGDVLEGLASGADDYLVKPVDPDELYARLLTGQRILDLQERLLGAQRQLNERAIRDSLTELLNRAAILESLEREMNRSGRELRPLTVILADIDHFKGINDTYGHVVGDHVLRHASQRMQAMLRPYDTIGRYGGEEFLIVLAGCDVDNSLTLAERLRRSVEVEPVSALGSSIDMTVSLGVAVWNGMSSMQDLIQLADTALYQAKREGRNRAVMAVGAG